MTTLDLAERIAYAVMASVYDHGTGFVWEGARDHAPAVLRVLQANQAWLCRVSESDTGITIDTPFEPVQLEFPDLREGVAR